jgi:hypothetical protein
MWNFRWDTTNAYVNGNKKISVMEKSLARTQFDINNQTLHSASKFNSTLS